MNTTKIVYGCLIGLLGFPCLSRAELFEINPIELCIEQAKKDGVIYVPTALEMKNYTRDCFDIAKELVKDQKHTAALTASSPWVVHHITKYITSYAPLRVLEVGAGSGTITQEIIQRLNPLSSFDVVEYNADLYAQLVKRLGDKQSNKIKLYNAAIEAWQPAHAVENHYDIIVSTVPITQLPLETMENILQRYKSMLKPGGLFIYVTLCGARTLTLWTKTVKHFMTESVNKMITIEENTRKALESDLLNYKTILQKLGEWQDTYFNHISTEVVFFNITPLYIICLQKK